MGSEDDKNSKPTYEDKFAKLELQIQTLANTFAEFMKASLKVEFKLEIYDYDGVVEAEKLDGWLDKLETYFTVHQLVESQKISFASLKFSNHASTWWKAYKKRYDTEHMTWQQFKELMKKHFYPMGYLDERWYKWQHLRQRYQQSVQDYTTKFYNQALALDVDITSDETFRKYKGGIVDYIRRELKLFSAQDIEDAINKVVAIEKKSKGAAGPYNRRITTRGEDKTQIRVETSKNKSPPSEREEKVCVHCKEKGHIKETCWILYPHLKPKKLRESEGQTSFKKNTMLPEALDTATIFQIYQPDLKLMLMTKLTDTELVNLHEELFHVKIQVKQNIVEAIIDSGSQKNLIQRSWWNKQDCQQLHIQNLTHWDGCERILNFRPVTTGEKKIVLHTTLSIRQESEISSLKRKIVDLFQEEVTIPPKRSVEHDIILIGDASLPNLGLYMSSITESEEIKKQVKELLEQRVIVQSCSPRGSPVLLVPKKDGGWRMCVDYRSLNKITIKNRYLLPRIDDLLDRLGDAIFFNKLDLKSGYHQLMNEVLQNFIDDFVIVYLDDILIFSKTWEEYLIHVSKVLSVLRENSLSLNEKKCEFGRQELVFLGFVIGKGKIKVDPEMVVVIYAWPSPRNITEIRSFLGACQYLLQSQPLLPSDYAQKYEGDKDFGEEYKRLSQGNSSEFRLVDGSMYKGKERLKGEGKKLKLICYGPFKILKQFGGNAFQLDLPPYMQMYSVINAEYLKLFEPPLLNKEDDQELKPPPVEDFWIKRE
ncbi:uncharacterized protein LOC113351745 [Papaver somniferum]|uniref:uncharacterized protein LOC113351745 n=1 Tax=Papaver somniferum TaxID=3469 RepID=UPI000E6F6DCB|nr:uncharacterized protein LOC113351745 [Papaver somniferum]